MVLKMFGVFSVIKFLLTSYFEWVNEEGLELRSNTFNQGNKPVNKLLYVKAILWPFSTRRRVSIL